MSHFPIPGTESVLLDGTEMVGAPVTQPDVKNV